MRQAFLLLLTAACGVSQLDVGTDEAEGTESEYALHVTSAQMLEVLAFVNHSTTTQAVLDGTLGLDRRAAAAIIAHRNRPDARVATADDDLFSSLDELDRVSYVGDAALAKLVAWALAHPIAAGETVKGVAFTQEQVSAVVWGVNQAIHDELDSGLGMDARAVNSLVAGKPYTTIAQMGARSYVGAVALTTLRSNASVWAAKRAGAGTLGGTFDGITFDEPQAKVALNISNRSQLQELLDAGLPIAGAAPMVGNRPYTTLGQVSAVSGVGVATMRALLAFAKTKVPVTPSVPDGGACDTAQRRCQTGLICSGLTVAPSGFCRPVWMANTFRSGTAYAIPDGDANGVRSGMTVTGLSTVAEDVIVHLELDHPRKQDLRIVLTQPSSAESTVWSVGSDGALTVIMGGGVERDSAVNGVWTLQVIDTVSGVSGTLNGWSLELTSRPD